MSSNDPLRQRLVVRPQARTRALEELGIPLDSVAVVLRVGADVRLFRPEARKGGDVSKRTERGVGGRGRRGERVGQTHQTILHMTRHLTRNHRTQRPPMRLQIRRTQRLQMRKTPVQQDLANLDLVRPHSPCRRMHLLQIVLYRLLVDHGRFIPVGEEGHDEHPFGLHGQFRLDRADEVFLVEGFVG